MNTFPSFADPIPGFDDANNDGDGEAGEEDDGLQMAQQADWDVEEQWTEPVAEALSQMLRVNSTLQRLMIYPGSFYEGFVAKVSAGLALNTGLLTLELDGCRNSDLEALGLALRTNTTLRQLDIGAVPCDGSRGNWTDAGAVSFASFVRGNTTLRHVSFGAATGFTRAGALAVATILLGSNGKLVLHLVSSLVYDNLQLSAAISALPNGLRQRVVGDYTRSY